MADGFASITREVDGSAETPKLKMPAVGATDLRPNEPRYVTLPNIMKAEKKPLDVFKPADLSVDVDSKIRTLKVIEPPRRGAGFTQCRRTAVPMARPSAAVRLGLVGCSAA